MTAMSPIAPNRTDDSLALQYDFNLGRILRQRLVPARSLAEGAHALRLTPTSRPVVDNSRWVVIRPRLSGICGSDVALLRGASSPYLAPLVSWPVKLGHEIVGVVESPDAPWPVGTRVVVNPSLPCEARGLTPCPACSRGRPDDCQRRDDATLGPGLLIGFNHQLPGGWSSRLWVPAGGLVPVPDSVDDRRAVLAEPASIALQGIDQVDWGQVATTLIIGAGTLGLLSSWLVGLYHPTVALCQEARYSHQVAMAQQVADCEVLQPRASGRAVIESPVLDAIAGPVLPRTLGAWPYRPGGFDLVIDTVGSPQTVSQSLTLTRPSGQVLLLGGAGRMPLDLTPVWSRRLTLRGSFGYGGEGTPQNATFQRVVSALASSPRPVEALVSHIVPLSDFKNAFRILGDHKTPSIKVVFQNDLIPTR